MSTFYKKELAKTPLREQMGADNFPQDYIDKNVFISNQGRNEINEGWRRGGKSAKNNEEKESNKTKREVTAQEGFEEILAAVHHDWYCHAVLFHL